jgi:putative sigma-54 modulation protein
MMEVELMQLEIKCRHFSLEDEQRERIEEKLGKLERFSPRPPVSARLTLTLDGGQFSADLGFLLKNSDFRARGAGTEPELAAEEVIENIRTQLQRYKGKVSRRGKAEPGGLGRAMLEERAPVPAAVAAPVEAEGFTLRSQSLEAAETALRETARPFHVFRNAQTGRLCVLYRRDDGELGLLEPRES